MSHARALATIVALALCVTRSAHAQSDRGGRIEGTVIDSVHTRPLAGVRVEAVGVESSTVAMRGAATTGSDGGFHIDSLPPGDYAVGFESPLLDSLEIALPPRAVTIAAGQTATVALALPPATKLRAALCPGIALPPQTGVIFGHVVDPESGSPLQGAVLALTWRELGVDRTTLRPQNSARSASATTDAMGWYRVCGVPTDTWLWLQLQHEGRSGPALRALVGDSLGIAVRHLSYSPAAARPMSDSTAEATDSVATQPLFGTALLSGIVRGAGDAPVASAQVGVRGARALSTTDTSGHYSLRGLPAGTQVLEVRRFGYAPAETSVDLLSGQMVTSDVRLQRVVNLDSIRVVAMRDRYNEFNEHRQHQKFGRFLGPEQMEQEHDFYMSDVIRKLGVFRVVGEGVAARVINRSYNWCGGPVNIIIDGMENQSINDVPTAGVGAVEVYRAGEIPPAKYNAYCGAIVVWTKR